MSLKSIIDVQIDDAQFQRFQQNFNRYQQDLAKASGQWRTAGTYQDAFGAKFSKVTSMMGVQSRLMREGVEDDKRRLASTTSSERLWTSMAKSSGSFAKNVLGATESLLKWTGLLSAVGGLLGAGGMFGIDRMAANVANERRSSMGLGMSIGQQKSFGINFNRLVDPDQFLGWMNTMETDVSKQGPAFALMGRGLTKDTAADSVSMLKAIRGLAQRTTLEQLGPILSSYGLNLNPEEQRRFKEMKDDEFNGLISGNARDSAALNIPDGVAKQWTELTKQLQLAGGEIYKTFVVGLVKLAEPLDKLSKAFVKFIEVLLKSDLVQDAISGLAHWMNEFSGTVAAPKFLDAVKQFTSDLGILSDTLHVITHPIKSLIGADVGTDMKWRENFLKDPSKPAYLSLLAETNRAFGLPAGTLEKQWQLESGSTFNPKDSSKGAIGAFQFKPGTAKQLGIDPHDPLQSAYGAGQYDAQLRDKYKGDMEKALAAYNVGPHKLDEIMFAYKDDWKSKLTEETQGYLKSMNSKAPGVNVNIYNNTGGSATVTSSQLAH